MCHCLLFFLLGYLQIKGSEQGVLHGFCAQVRGMPAGQACGPAVLLCLQSLVHVWVEWNPNDFAASTYYLSSSAER
jgi:hypothetical protein